MQTFEVEIKFRVKNADELEMRLQQQFGGAAFGEQVEELDLFFQHPSRNFIETDECLRLRKRIFLNGTSEHFLTYKGKKIDTNTKTRQEIETLIVQPDSLESILFALGFQKSASVRKFRRRMSLSVEGRRVDVVHDILPDLHESTRQFVEMETIAPQAELEVCRKLILSLAQQQGLSEPIRESYLNLVQQQAMR